MKIVIKYLIFCCLGWSTTSYALPIIEHPLLIGNNERLVVFAPHPDDETLSSAGLIHHVMMNSGSVRNVVVTAGDAYIEAIQRDTGKRHLKPNDFLIYGKKRLDESRHAAFILGNGEIKLDLLGFSDGSIYSMLVSHWRRQNPLRSDFTEVDRVPYLNAKSYKGLAQDGEDLLLKLVNILHQTSPTLIAFPDVMENDSDHAGLGVFVLLAIHHWLSELPLIQQPPRLLAYLIHWQNNWPLGSNWGIALDWSQLPMRLPDDLPLRGHSRSCLVLNSKDIDLKRNALAQYQTQQRAMGDFLAAFIRKTECYTLFNIESTKSIESIVENWQHSQKKFDKSPAKRSRI